MKMLLGFCSPISPPASLRKPTSLHSTSMSIVFSVCVASDGLSRKEVVLSGVMNKADKEEGFKCSLFHEETLKDDEGKERVVRTHIRTRTVLYSDEVVDLSELGLDSLPKQLENCRSIRKLVLRSNRLSALPRLSGAIRELDVAFNQLAPSVELPGGLTALHIGWNDLAELPRLPIGLRTLRAQWNRLTSLTLPPMLEELWVSGNPLKSLPPMPSSMRRVLADVPFWVPKPALHEQLDSVTLT